MSDRQKFFLGQETPGGLQKKTKKFPQEPSLTFISQNHVITEAAGVDASRCRQVVKMKSFITFQKKCTYLRSICLAVNQMMWNKTIRSKQWTKICSIQFVVELDFSVLHLIDICMFKNKPLLTLDST